MIIHVWLKFSAIRACPNLKLIDEKAINGPTFFESCQLSSMLDEVYSIGNQSEQNPTALSPEAFVTHSL